MKSLFFILIFALFSSSLFGQMAVYEHFGLTYASGDKVSAPSIMYHQTLAFGKDQLFRFGLGIRASGFFGNEKTFNSDARNLTIHGKSQVTSINIPVSFEVHGKKLLVGANVDLIGFAYGSSIDSLTVTNYPGRLDTLSATPVGFNFLIGRHGTLNSEVYVGYSPQPEITIRLGVSFISSQYSTTYYSLSQKKYIDFDKFRYQAKAIPFISVVFNFER